MKKLLAVIIVSTFSVGITGCGPQKIATGVPTEKVEMPTDESGTVGPPPTQIVLKTPTPRPAPPTPTPIPPTPTPEKEEKQTAEPEPPKPAVTDIMIEIPAGPFTMGNDEGDPEDMPAHEVDLPAFEIDKFETTNADFATFVEETGYVTFAEKQGYRNWRDEWGEGEDSHPVVMVVWEDAAAYCQWLGKRLPTEVEWEKAARGTDGRRFPWGNEWDPSKANVKETELRGTVAVGSFGAGASPYGVEDMGGNVWEWTADWYQPYPGNTTEDSHFGEQFRVTRGGGWFDLEPQVTTFNRNAADPNKTAIDELGFRCAR